MYTEACSCVNAGEFLLSALTLLVCNYCKPRHEAAPRRRIPSSLRACCPLDVKTNPAAPSTTDFLPNHQPLLQLARRLIAHQRMKPRPPLTFLNVDVCDGPVSFPVSAFPALAFKKKTTLT